ncbi:MAG: Spy/CpxP family protein refolding chaperone [Acidobacteriota bacterium]|nr:Spy/CpxP family protein refolding chaperone [Acidobacteriota bacterium]
MTLRTTPLLLLVLLTPLAGWAQRGFPPDRPPMERGFRPGPGGRWWTDPALVEKLGLTADQQKRIDDLFQQSRLKLIDLSAAVQKQEAVLDPLLSADRPDESKVLVQIDRIAQARAELEKANARMLLGFRNVLSPEQWKKMQSETPRPPDHRRNFQP